MLIFLFVCLFVWVFTRVVIFCLQTDQVDVRIKALNLAGRIFAQPNHCSGEIYRDLFVEFLRRFSDKSAEVRMAALKCGKQCYLANPSGNKASGVLSNIHKAFSLFALFLYFCLSLIILVSFLDFLMSQLPFKSAY